MEQPHPSTRTKRYSVEQAMVCPTSHIFNDMRLQGELCDAVLVVDGVEFEVHKIILCGCSSYFRALFTSGLNIKEKQEYDIPGISPEAMRLVIDYAYTHSVFVTVDDVESLLAAADQFDIPGIMQCCSNILEDLLCLENCIAIYGTTDLYRCPELRRSALCLILENFKEVASTSEFLELTLSQLCEIIEKDELNIRQEDVVFDAILRWIMHEPSSRKAYISVLLPKVRMARMDEEFFMNNVKNHDLVKASEECRPIVRDALKAMYDLNINSPPYSDFENPLIQPRLPSVVLLAIGGFNGRTSNVIEAYDSRADRWVDMAQCDENPCCNHGTAYLNGFVYCIGGYHLRSFHSDVRSFNPITRTWQQVAPMCAKRCFISVAVLDGFIYAMGGYDGSSRLDTAERYDPKKDCWNYIQTMNARRSDASATALHGKIYICGGYSGTEFLSTAECYDPLTNEWTMIPPMRSVRCGLGVIACHGKIYAVGGSNRTECLKSVEAYDPQTNRWHFVAPMFNRHNKFGIELVDDLIFVVGGRNGSTATNEVECFDAETGSWYRAQDMRLPRWALSCCAVPSLRSFIKYAAPR